jgi:A/G-specific adenine glycosylase
MKYPPSNREIGEVRDLLLEWGQENYNPFPWRNPERDWHGLIAEILLQRTNADSVTPVFERFCQRYPKIEDFAEATEREIEELMRPLGLRKRAALLDSLGDELYRLGDIPTNREELENLPGVGPYTAGAWLCFHKGDNTSIVDSNVVRWLCRMIGHDYDRNTRRKSWFLELADRITPEDRTRQFNYAVLDFTRKICTPTGPSCTECPIGPPTVRLRREQSQQKIAAQT